MAKTRKRKRRGVIKTVFNPRGWMSYDDVKESGREVKDLVKDVTDVRKPGRKETFEQAMKRMKLSEEDIQVRMKQLLLSSRIYCGAAVLVLFYSLFTLFYAGNFWTFLMAAIISVLGFALAFRDSFYYFQMKRRKLGCTVKEWIQFITGKGTSSSKDLK